MFVSPRSLHIFQTIPRRSGDEWNKSQKGGETVVLNYCLEAVFASLENVYSKKLYSNFSSLIILNSESLFNLELIGMFLFIMFKAYHSTVVPESQKAYLITLIISFQLVFLITDKYFT